VVAFIGSLKVAEMDGLRGTPVAASAGPVVRTDGAVFGALEELLLHPAASSTADASRSVRGMRCSWVISSLLKGVSGRRGVQRRLTESGKVHDR
jgi:hypothetical protein